MKRSKYAAAGFVATMAVLAVACQNDLWNNLGQDYVPGTQMTGATIDGACIDTSTVSEAGPFSKIVIEFDKDIDASSVTGASVTVCNANAPGTCISGLLYSVSCNTVIISTTAVARYPRATTLQVTLKPTVVDTEGNHLAQAYSFKIATAAAPLIRAITHAVSGETTPATITVSLSETVDTDAFSAAPAQVTVTRNEAETLSCTLQWDAAAMNLTITIPSSLVTGDTVRLTIPAGVFTTPSPDRAFFPAEARVYSFTD